MSYQDLLTFKPESVKFIEEEKSILLLSNPLYRPILIILREGPKSLKEIKEVYSKYSDREEPPPDKTLYRHLKTLKDAQLVTDAGKRVSLEQDSPITEKLFSRTAKFFYLIGKHKEVTDKKKITKRAKIISKILSFSDNINVKSIEDLSDFLNKLHSSEITISNKLFEEFADELADSAGNLPFDELEHLLEDYITIKILLEKDSYEKQLKEIFKD